MQKVQLIGNVGKEPEIKIFDDGGKIATFTMAVNERGFTTKSGTKVPDRSEWFNISVSGDFAGVVEKYVHKGDKLYIEGKQRTRQYDDKSGQTKYFVEINVSELEMLGTKEHKEDEQRDIPRGQPVASYRREQDPFANPFTEEKTPF